MPSRRSSSRSTALTLPALTVAVCVSALSAGCANMTFQADTPPPAASNAELMDYIGNQPFVTAETGYRAAHILWKGAAFDGDFAALAGTLQQSDIAGDSWGHGPNDCLDRATVGYLVCRACDINGGINWPLTGLGRYAWKELQYRRIAQPSGEMGYISGGEFLGVLMRAEDYLHKSAGTVQRAELGERR